MEREGGESASDAVIRGIAAIEDVPVTDLDPLYGSICAESLDGLFGHADAHGASARVSFEFEGYTIHVRNDRTIRIADRTADPPLQS
jgi:hypothetical protein